ncbi:hypothetical protein FRX31_004752 [Thalictrum thalictroides]|uniref:Uncharacterized protein n=1 Tax=Thalictrum thalictroides TaxID=46969 RepID=A0A7J6XBC0_THATH|nr:hypothetical protein FRX31_004752 [Thalictrum thalictroides]
MPVNQGRLLQLWNRIQYAKGVFDATRLLRSENDSLDPYQKRMIEEKKEIRLERHRKMYQINKKRMDKLIDKMSEVVVAGGEVNGGVEAKSGGVGEPKSGSNGNGGGVDAKSGCGGEVNASGGVEGTDGGVEAKSGGVGEPKSGSEGNGGDAGNGCASSYLNRSSASNAQQGSLMFLPPSLPFTSTKSASAFPMENRDHIN